MSHWSFASRLISFPLVVALTIICNGCAESSRTEFTADDQTIAQVPSFSDIRAWGDGNRDDFRRLGLQSPKSGQTLKYLALSGGGAGGAFGAGLLVGWTASGKRPTFDVVSGVSTGALAAPFAFLGPKHDSDLTYLYTSGITDSIVKPKPLISVLTGNSLASSDGLEQLISHYVTPQFLDEIAAEYRKGRHLFVITTNLDAQRSVVWDMTRIAASGQPDATKLFRQILLASASIPGAFPPVLIDATANGHHFKEMHVDGAAIAQVFTIPDGTLLASKKNGNYIGVKTEIYIVINSPLAPEFDVTANAIIPISVRAISTLIKSQTKSSLDATYFFAKRSGIQFELAYIEGLYKYDPSNPFDLNYMKTMYKVGYEGALTGSAWHSTPKIQDTPVRVKPIL